MDSISPRATSIGLHRVSSDSLKANPVSKEHGQIESKEKRVNSEATKLSTIFRALAKLFLRDKKPKELQKTRFQHIASGKAKRVFADRLSNQHVYYTPVAGTFEKIFGTKKAEIQNEVKIASEIKQTLSGIGVSSGTETFIATDLKEIMGTDDLEGFYVIQATRAGDDGKKTDLDKLLKDRLETTERLEFCDQVLKGIAYLHKAGYVHGDLKGDNILHFRELQPNGEVKSVLRVGDFGKSRKVEENDSVLHTGNLRFAAPEGRLSKKGEVFSAALLLIRIMEEEVLQKTGRTMVVKPERLKSDQPGEGHRGITKFVVTNDLCVQTDSKNIQGKIRLISGSARAIMNVQGDKQKTSSSEVKKYIGTLFAELKKDKSTNEVNSLKKMEQLLLSMTDENPTKRPSMQSALEQFEEVMKLYNAGINS